MIPMGRLVLGLEAIAAGLALLVIGAFLVAQGRHG